MLNTRTFLSLSVMSVALTLAACNTMQASNTLGFSAKLAAASEVPPNDSTGTGTLVASLDRQSHVLTWTLTYAGMSGPVKAGHFHGPAAAGTNAGVVLPFTGSVESPIKGTATLSEAQVADLTAGKWYVNLHTPAHPGGEVRGQVLPAQ